MKVYAVIKVLIVEIHSMIRRRLHQALAKTCDIVVTGEASNGLEVQQEIAHNDFDVVLLDIAMPGGGGLEVLHRLIHDKPGLRVLVLSAYHEQQYMCRVLKEGASGYLTKDRISEELIPAMRQVACGMEYVPAESSGKQVDARGQK